MNWEELKEAKLPIVLYGMGDGADRILAALAAHGLQAAGVFASDEFVRGQVFHSFPVLQYEEAKRRFGRMLVLLAFGTGLPAVLARIDQIAQEQTLLAPDFPVVGNTPFDRAFCEAHRAELETVHSRLADAQSRRVFEDLLAYKRSCRSGIFAAARRTRTRPMPRSCALGRARRSSISARTRAIPCRNSCAGARTTGRSGPWSRTRIPSGG